MNRSSLLRRTHRWVSMAFTLTVIANFIARAQGPAEPPPWLTYAPLPPLGLLLLTGLYLFALPYFGRRHGGRNTSERGTPVV